MSVIPLFLLFLSTLPIRPYVPLRQIRLDALLMPLSLPFLPSSSFGSIPDPRPFEIARCIVRLFLAYALSTGVASVLRTLKRIGGWKIKQSSTANLIKMSLLWLLAWRCSTLPFIPSSKTGLILTERERFWDVTSLVALGVGITCSVDEIREIFRLIGLSNPDQNPKSDQNQDQNQTPKSGLISRIIQIILSIHRILLAVRVISAAFAPVNVNVPIEPLESMGTVTGS